MTNHLWILGFSKIWVKIEIWWWPAGGRWQRWQRSRVQSRKLSTNGARQPQKKSADFSGACTFHTNVHFCSKIHNICTCVGERGITIFGFFSSKKSALVLSMASLKGIFWDHFPIDELMSDPQWGTCPFQWKWKQPTFPQCRRGSCSKCRSVAQTCWSCDYHLW